MTSIEKEIIGTMENLTKNIAGVTGSLAAATYLIKQKMESLSDHDRNVLSDGVQTLLENEKQILVVAQTLKSILQDHP